MLQGLYSLRHVGDANDKAESSARMVMEALDRNGDGQLSAREFIAAAARNPTIVAIIDGKA